MKTAMSSTGPISLQLLGLPMLLLANEELKLPIKKMLGLIAYLALEGPSERSKLAGLFWTDLEEGNARRNLRRELHRLRETPLKHYLQSEGESINLESSLTNDVAEYQKAVSQLDDTSILKLYKGALLKDFELPGAEGFMQWLELKRQSLARDWEHAMLRQAERLETLGRFREALNLHLQLLEHDTLQEQLQREIMRLYYQLGERDSALKHFENLRLSLKQELGLEPLPETLQLVEQIRSTQILQTSQAVKAQVLPVLLALKTPLVGRKEIWERLEVAWEARQLIVLTGEAGIGKTRLLKDFAQAKGLFQVNQGRPADLGIPFATFSRSVRNLLLENPNQQLAPWVRFELARLIPEIGDRPSPALHSQEERLRLYEAVFEFTEQASRDKTALLSDDLQYFDSSSIEMAIYTFERFLEQTQPRLLLSFRTEELQPEAEKMLAHFFASGVAIRLALEPLEESALLDLVRRMSGAAEGQLFSRRLYKATAGNPFFVLETLKTLFESGSLRLTEQGNWETPFDQETTDYQELPIPKTVREAVLRRVVNLGEAARRLLEAACLVEDGFSLETLQGATALTDWEALEALERALDARIIEPFNEGYKFTHDLLAQSLTEALSAERKQLLHLKLANSLERMGANAASIARHLEQGGRLLTAIPWHIRAAEAATQVYAHKEALEHYQRALEASQDPRIKFELYCKRIALFQNFIHDDEQWQRELARIENLANGLEAPDLLHEACLAWIDYFVWHSQDNEALERIDWILEQTNLSSQEAARALEFQAFVLANKGQLDASDEARHKALSYLSDQPSALRGRVRYGQLMNAYKRADYESARSLAKLCQAEFQAVGASHYLINVYIMQGILAAIAGEIEKAIALLERARSKAETIGHSTYQRSALFNLFELNFARGQMKAAHANLSEVETLTPRFTDPVEEAAFRRFQSQAAWFSGDIGSALSLAKQALELDERASVMEYRLLGRLVLSGYYLKLSAIDQAKVLLGETEALLEAAHMGFHASEFQLKRAILELEQENPKALERLERLQANIDQLQTDEVIKLKCLLAKAYLAQQKPADAVAVLASVAKPSLIESRLELAVMTYYSHLAMGNASEHPSLDELISLLEGGLVALPDRLPLYRALLQTQSAEHSKKAKAMQQKVKRYLDELALSLGAYPEIQQRFLHKNQDLLSS